MVKRLLQILVALSLATFGAAGASAFQAADGDSTDSVYLEWVHPSYATGYTILRSAPDATSPPGSSLATTTADNFTDTTAEPGIMYKYWLRARVCPPLAGCYNVLTSDTGYRRHPAPTNVTASHGTYPDKVRVTWDPVPGVRVSISRWYLINHLENLVNGEVLDQGVFDDTTALPGEKYEYNIYFLIGEPPYSTGSESVFRVPGWRGLTAPSGVNATDGTHTGMVRVSWNAQPCDGYRVLRATASGGPYQEVARYEFPDVTFDETYDDATVTPGATYYYAVQSMGYIGGIGLPGWVYSASSTNTGWGNFTAPTGLTASPGTHTDRVQLSWNAVPGATGYHVLITGPSGTTAQGGSASTQYSHTSATPLAHYDYQVRATAGAHWGPTCSPATGWRSFSGPGGVSASDGGYSPDVRIQWSAVGGAPEYEVHRSIGAGGTKTLVGTAVGVTTLFDSGAAPGAIYHYWVRAKSAYGTGPFGTPDTGYAFAAPAGLAATDGSYPTHVSINWEAVDGAWRYEVYRATSPDGTQSLLGDVSVTQFTDWDVVLDQVYYYWVRAATPAGGGPFAGPEAGYAHSPLLFSDDFSRCDRTGAPGWSSVLGKWRCTPKHSLYPATASRRSNLVIVTDPSLPSFSTGVLRSSVRFPKLAADRSSVALVFARAGRSYRYARLMKLGRRVLLLIGQVGEIDGEPGGRRARVTLPRTFDPAKVNNFWVEIHPSGLVEASVSPQYGTLTASFASAPAGQVGYHASRAKVLCGSFSAWDETAIPW